MKTTFATVEEASLCLTFALYRYLCIVLVEHIRIARIAAHKFAFHVDLLILQEQPADLWHVLQGTDIRLHS